jgi:sterol desaturase/sphingolipid hydroxylase (fatty acid hydroxylase superfamily)
VKVDLTVLAIPGFIAAMAAEYAWQRRHPAAPGERRAGDYELKDTIASLTMGVGSLAAPHVSRRLLDPLTPGVGRGAKLLIGGAVLASAATTALDVIRRRAEGRLPAAGVVRDEDRPGRSGRPDRITAGMALAAVGATSLAAATSWAAMTSGTRLFERGGRDAGSGAGAVALAILGWDAIYYWNHRLSHESRWLWAVHVVHHSSERYNLSTALRQPVAEGVTMAVPYGLLAWLGVRPSLIEQARALNLIYQFWIHTEVVRSIGWLEKVLNTPSHHRVHHGSNSQYLDRNHGSILIIWDKIFGTFEPEREPVDYGLTTNIASFNPVVIAGHEWRDMAQDIARSLTWSDRIGFVLRGPGWASDRRRELSSTAAA